MEHQPHDAERGGEGGSQARRSAAAAGTRRDHPVTERNYGQRGPGVKYRPLWSTTLPPSMAAQRRPERPDLYVAHHGSANHPHARSARAASRRRGPRATTGAGCPTPTSVPAGITVTIAGPTRRAPTAKRGQQSYDYKQCPHRSARHRATPRGCGHCSSTNCNQYATVS